MDRYLHHDKRNLSQFRLWDEFIVREKLGFLVRAAYEIEIRAKTFFSIINLVTVLARMPYVTRPTIFA